MTQPFDGGELLVTALSDLGVDYIFSSPGSEWAPVWEALARRARDGVDAPRYLDLTHETVAVAMATGYGLVTRRPQAVLLHAAPGLLQGGMAMHGALLAGVGMVVASSESTTYGEGDGPDPGGQWYRNLSIVGGPHQIAQPFTKWANEAASVTTLHGMVTRAGELAAAAPSGPVYLNVPLEVLLDPVTPPSDPYRVVRRGRTVAVDSDLEAVAELLVNARQPIVITETAGRDDGGFEALLALCEELGVGVIEPTSAVCGNFPKSHPLHLGGEIEPLIDDADLILLVNCRAPFYPPSRRPAHARIVVIDDVPQRPHIVYQVLRADYYLEGDLPETLDRLRVIARGGAVDAAAFDERMSRHARAHEAWAESTTELERRAGAQVDQIDPVLLAMSIRILVGEVDGVVVDETITHGRVVQRHVGWERPDRYFYVQGGLGQGIGVALGVKLAVSEQLVVLTIGDGAFLYNPIVQSLMAAKQCGLPLLIVIFNNKKYLSMKMNHLRFYPKGAAVETGNHLGVDLADQPELSAFAAPFDMFHAAVDNPAELDGVLAAARDAVMNGTTAVVNVSVSR